MVNSRFKFRGKSIETGEWIYGYYVYTHDRHRIIYEDYEGFYCEEEVNPETVGQYISLKDKNGEEIYEGDIVETVTARGNPFGTIDVVRYQDGGFKLVDDTDSLLPIYIGDKEVISIEIIGNIYENPELLEESK